MTDQRKADGDGPDGGQMPHAGLALSGSEFAGLGIQLGVTVTVFALAGVWVDRRLGTSPLFLLVFLFTGTAGTFYSIYRKLNRGKGLGHTSDRSGNERISGNERK